MNDIDKYLKDCVYYPCSGFHGIVVKVLSKRFLRFFYADYFLSREDFDDSINDGFKGYRLSKIEDLTPEEVFKMSWRTLRNKHGNKLKYVDFEWADRFIVLCQFERTSDYDDEHGPAMFELIYARCEAVTAYIEAFSSRNITPKCLVHIRSGVGFGGNYTEYPQILEQVVRANNGGMPSFMFFDRMGSEKNSGNYLPLIEEYDDFLEIRGYPDGGRLTLSRASSHTSV